MTLLGVGQKLHDACSCAAPRCSSATYGCTAPPGPGLALQNHAFLVEDTATWSICCTGNMLLWALVLRAVQFTQLFDKHLEVLH